MKLLSPHYEIIPKPPKAPKVEKPIVEKPIKLAKPKVEKVVKEKVVKVDKTVKAEVTKVKAQVTKVEAPTKTLKPKPVKSPVAAAAKPNQRKVNK